MTILGILIALPLMFVGVTIYGFVLQVLWGWFLTPTLGLPPLSIAQAIGVSLAIRFITHQDLDCVKPQRDTLESIAYHMGQIFLVPAIVLVVGYIVHLFL